MFLQAKRLVIAEAQYGEQRQEAIHVIINNVVFKTLIATSLTLNIILEITINWWKRLHVADTPRLNQCTFAIQVLVDTAQPSQHLRNRLPRLSLICINVKSVHGFQVRLKYTETFNLTSASTPPYVFVGELCLMGWFGECSSLPINAV